LAAQEPRAKPTLNNHFRTAATDDLRTESGGYKAYHTDMRQWPACIPA
jgi:hypothetical protein